MIDTMTYLGQERRRWHFEGGEEYWIEGIGSCSGLIHGFYTGTAFLI
ncbi:MAG: hypothetical protein U5Q03_19760 [Bacteroidota bacterium]|nr:hypothetical protein [Bacteroidota bacterium]